MSEGVAFRSAAFGGFHKKDVMTYISETSQRYQEEIRWREMKMEAIRKELEQAQQENAALRSRVAELEANATDETELAELEAACQAKLTEIQENFQQKLDACRQEAEGYRLMREKLGQIEMDARVRALTVEREADQRASETISAAQEKHDQIVGNIRAEAEELQERLSQLLGSVCSSFDNVHSGISESIANAMGEVEHVRELLLALNSSMEEHSNSIHQIDVPSLQASDEMEADLQEAVQ